jgi:urease subunit gamma/beta
MLLTPTEYERLTLFSAAQLARKRHAKGLKLNYPEAVAIISDELLEGAREGKTVAELIGFGSTILNQDDVLPGIADMLPMLQVEGSFPDGTKLITVHDPLRPGIEKPATNYHIPGEIITPEGDIELNVGRVKATVKAVNTGDRPIQIGSHFHFFEVNRALQFEREKAYGMHLDIPAGTAIRFEPGDEKTVALVAFGGTREIFGLNAMVDGSLDAIGQKERSIVNARDAGFRGA